LFMKALKVLSWVCFISFSISCVEAVTMLSTLHTR
jgi:hypothetical protein